MFFKNVSLLVLSVFSSISAYACSSCGSSATSPLVMYPGENFKIYVGTSENYNYINYGLKGATATTPWYDDNLYTRQTTTLAVGYRTTAHSFVSLTGSLIHNEGVNTSSLRNKDSYLIGDPILSARYTLVEPEIAQPFMPQVQVLASYKPSVAKNMIDDDRDHVDSAGNGFHQASSGLDLWWGMPFIQFGGSEFVTYSFPNFSQSQGHSKRTRDLQSTSIFTVGHAFDFYHIAAQVGVVLDYIGQEHNFYQDNRPEVVTPSQQSNSMFVTLNWNATSKDLIRFSYSHGGVYDGDLGPFTNKNQTTSNMALVAYERTFF
jgi:hypothetical protein